MINTYPSLSPAEEPEETPYCPVCRGCGESPCCGPGVCRHFECWYGQSYVRSYRDISECCNQYYCTLLALGLGDPGAWDREKVEDLGIGIDDLLGFLKCVGSLYVLGYNACHAQNCEDETDETGTSLLRYEREAQRLEAWKHRLQRKLKRLRDEYRVEIR